MINCENKVVDLEDYDRFRVVIKGHISEYAVNVMSLDLYRGMKRQGKYRLTKMATHPAPDQRGYSHDFRALQTFREWDQVEPYVHAAGMVVDSDLQILVENGEGFEFADVTSLVHEQTRYRYANDNEEIILSAGDFVNLDHDEPSTKDRKVGMLEVKTYQHGYVETVFDGFTEFNPSKLSFDIRHIGSKPILQGISYEGCDPSNVEHSRSNYGKPFVDLRIVRM